MGSALPNVVTVGAIDAGSILGLPRPRELVVVIAVLAWPLGAWLVVTLRGVPRSEAWRSFARAAAIAGVLAVILIVLGTVAFVTNGAGGGMAGFAVFLLSSVPLLWALLSGLVALLLRANATGDVDPQRKALLVGASAVVVALVVLVGWWLLGGITPTPPPDAPPEPEPPAPTSGAFPA